MKTKEQSFYEIIDKLMISTEKSNDLIQKEDIAVLYELVKNEIDFGEPLKIDNEDSFFTEFEFENKEQERADSKYAFRKFVKFMTQNNIKLSKKLKRAVASAALKIHGIETSSNSKSARSLMSQLKKELQAL
ncbi:MAG: hypothetical protein WCK02_09055 [Bacteroidota bacterium]